MSDFDIREFYGRYVDAINAHEWHRIGEFMADTIVSHGQTVTREQGVAAFASITDAMPDYRVELKTLTISGNTVGSHAITRGTPEKEWLGVAPTGTSIEIDEVTVYKIENGKFTQMSNVWDVDALKLQLTR
jgi:predicted ester cyclase